MSLSPFTEKEIRFLTDTDFLLTKKEIMRKIRAGLKNCSNAIDEELGSGNYLFNKNHLQVAPKISIGENYRGLPYAVLDNPRYFTKSDVLSYRVILWWGHYLSFSLHLEGPASLKVLNSILLRKGKVDNDVYYCIAANPWKYHFEEDNFMPLADISSEKIRLHFKNHGFMKLAKKATLDEWPFLNNLAIKNLQLFAELTSLARQF